MHSSSGAALTATALTRGTEEACLDDDENTDREALLSFALFATLSSLLLLLLRTLLATLTALLLLLLKALPVLLAVLLFLLELRCICSCLNRDMEPIDDVLTGDADSNNNADEGR